MKNLLILAFLLFAQAAVAQNPYPATPAGDRLAGFEQRKALNEQSLLSNIEFRSVGPTVMSGRVAAIELNPENPAEFYVGYACGGLWKTTNNGTTFEPLFDNEAVQTVGDVAVHWSTGTIWVGTGENNSSRSSYSGTGMYKSDDGGETWAHVGLPESHHIGRIVLHPDNADVAWVGVLGHLYSPNSERGIYKTTDGGKTWTQTLSIGVNTGIIDMVIHPENPDELYAAAWDRMRRAWNFWEGGQGSGIYKSIDGGQNWKLVTTGENGFPIGLGTGRIGIDLWSKDGKTSIFAVVDNQNRRPEEEKEEEDKLTKNDLRDMTNADFLKLEKNDVTAFIKDNNYPDTDEFKTDNILEKMKDGSINPNTLVAYLEDANAMLFDTEVVGAEVYRSDDGGQTWVKTHEDYLDDLFYSYGYYFGQIRVAAYDPDKVFIMGVPILISEDGGKTWKSINGDNVHVDHHALEVDPNFPGHLVNGNDGGVNVSFDYGETWTKCNSPAVGTFYAVNVDMAKPYNIYGGLQDNGVWTGSSRYKANDRWHSTGRYPYKSIMGGDGMQIAVDTRDNQTIYTGYQFGNYYRVNKNTGEDTYITPKHKLGERPYRWNWQAPIHLSSHNQDVLYMGSNKFHRSLDQGDTFETLSDDLTLGGKKGDVAFGTLTSIDESPLRFGMIYVGSDDGLVHVSKDGGYTWNNISEGLPKNLWVSRVQASKHELGRVLVSLNGYRWDHFDSYVYISEDFGENWKRVGQDLPAEPVNVFKEDPENPDVLYVGTDHGLYVSLNSGQSFMGMNGGLPDSPVHDLVIHPREKDLIIATHGRSIYVADAELVQKLDDDILAKAFHLFDLKKVNYRSSWGSTWSKWLEPTEPEVHFPLYSDKEGKVNVSIKHGDLELYSFEEDVKKGINYLTYNLWVTADKVKPYEEALNKDVKDQDDRVSLKEADNGKFYLYKGKYTVELSRGKAKTDGSFEVKGR